MTDKYDDAVAYLTAHPEEIVRAWCSPERHIAGCLFDYCEKYPGPCGCLTSVRAGEGFAETDELTTAIRDDDRIPNDLDDITVKDLPVFAAWQRRIDVELGREA